jgi:hypothetical protein
MRAEQKHFLGASAYLVSRARANTRSRRIWQGMASAVNVPTLKSL